MQDGAELIAQLTDLLITIAGFFLQSLVQNLLQACGCSSGPGYGERFRLIVNHRMAHIDS